MISDDTGTSSDAVNLTSFYVAKQPNLKFSAPVKVIGLPPADPTGSVLNNGEVLGPLGYAARPVPGDPNGGCGASGTLPLGMKFLEYRESFDAAVKIIGPFGIGASIGVADKCLSPLQIFQNLVV